MSNAAGARGTELIKAIGSLIITLVVFAVVLFAAAGTLTWIRGWWFLIAFGVLMIVASGILWRVNPEIFAARRGIGKGTKVWDLIVVPIIMLGFATILVIGALDDGRFHWSRQPLWIVAVGYVLFVLAFAVETWAQAVNRHFEPSVRIQTDRDHHVIETGPYAYVRHPGYVAAVVLCTGMALAMGSLWALVPVAVLTIVLVIRTALEDATLKRELSGYQAYAGHVRFRWIPGVW